MCVIYGGVNMYYNHDLAVVLPYLGLVVGGCIGWYFCDAKHERARKVEELRIAVTPSVYLEDLGTNYDEKG